MIYTHNDLQGHYLHAIVVVIAPTVDRAAQITEDLLRKNGLEQKVKPEGFKPFPRVGDQIDTGTRECVLLLSDGDY